MKNTKKRKVWTTPKLNRIEIAKTASNPSVTKAP